MEGKAPASILLMINSIILILSIISPTMIQSQSIVIVDDNKLQSPLPSPNPIQTNSWKAIFDPNKCWKTIKDVEGSCFTDIYTLIMNNTFTLHSPCCVAIVDIGDDCLGFYFRWYFLAAPILKKLCGFLKESPRGSGTSKVTNMGELSLGSFTLGNPAEMVACFTTIQSIEGCTGKVIDAIINGWVEEPIGSSCCKALVDVKGNCWTKLLSTNQFVPQVLTENCMVQLQGGGAAQPSTST